MIEEEPGEFSASTWKPPIVDPPSRDPPTDRPLTGVVEIFSDGIMENISGPSVLRGAAQCKP